ncbi:MAG: CvpA family protein [Clostridia bacterium]|nr:CvpA family protein [Clostridia bacterium]
MNNMLLSFKAGLVADLVVAVMIIINLIICTRKGFIRCVISSVSTVLAFAVAVFAAAPLATVLENKFGWETKIANWHVPFVSARILLCLLVGIAIFIGVRLLCILLDKLLQIVKQKLKAVNVIDRIMGTVFGLFSALVELTFIFMLIDQLGWTANLSLTADAGGYFAYRLFNFCHDYLFDIFGKVVVAASEYTII